MRVFLIRLIQKIMTFTPYVICSRRKILPPNSLYVLDLVLAYHRASGEAMTIVQVGACDGVETDPLMPFISAGGVRAILIEPNPVAFELLQKTYAGVPNVTLIQTAIGEQDGEAYLYRVRDGHLRGTKLNPQLGLSSFDRDHLVRAYIPSDDIERVTVPCRSLASLVSELGLKKIDLLLIDVEGYDAEVIRMALDLPVRPACIECEYSHLSVKARYDIFARLEGEGYLVDYNSWNLLALQKEVLEKWQIGK